MSTSPSSSPTLLNRADALAGTLAFWTLRLWLAIRAILTGLDKYAGTVREQVPLLDEFGQPDINGTMVDVERKVYGLSHYAGLPKPLADRLAAEPLMPGWALSAYGTLLGPLLILGGLALLLGVAPRITLFVHGLIYVSLSVGMILLNENSGIAWLAIHVLMVAAALRLVAHDRYSLLPRW
jgi:thiosulfate dehydrogenase (quinone) large subunit